MVLNEEYIEKLKKKFDEYDKVKNEVINKSIEITRLSKSIIYSLIRDDKKSAEKYIEEINKKVEEIKGYLSKYPFLYPNISIALQEYAEALIFYHYLTENRIPTHEELGVDEVSYINGLLDFTGELSRKATEEMIKDNLDFAIKVKKVVEDIYLKMLYMEFKNFDLRKKVDYVASNLNWLNEKIFYKTLFKGSLKY